MRRSVACFDFDCHAAKIAIYYSSTLDRLVGQILRVALGGRNAIERQTGCIEDLKEISGDAVKLRAPRARVAREKPIRARPI